MQNFPAIILCLLFCALLPDISFARVELYTGSMAVVRVSGKACAGLAGSHDVTLVLRQAGDGAAVSGYFTGQEITSGRFSGSGLSKLEVRYPYHDEFKASGHFLSITQNDNGLQAELNDRPLDPAVDDCNFDLARMTLTLRDAGEQAEAGYRSMEAQFVARLTRSQAFNLARSGRYDSALPLYEKALAQADAAAGGSEALLAPYITGLANAYVKLDLFDEFNRFYDERINAIRDEGVRVIFTSYRVSALLKAGKARLAREEYPAALESFEKAFLLLPQNREVIASVMMVHLLMEDFGGAIAFLEGALKNIDNENVQQDVRGALAYVYSTRSRKFEKEGRAVEAEADLASAYALDSHTVKYLVALARLRHKAGSLAEAEKLLQNGLKHFQDKESRQEIISALGRMRRTDAILKKLSRAGG